MVAGLATVSVVLKLEKFSFGVGDRFAHQAKAQLHAFQMLAERGVDVVPVWNKSNREHLLIGSEPQSVFEAAQSAVNALGWRKGWHVDADHIRLETVDRFLASSDFFTIDVADSIGVAASDEAVEAFASHHQELIGTVEIAGIAEPLQLSQADLRTTAARYIRAVEQAGIIYRHIAAHKGGKDEFITEVSMDETDSPQTPPQLLVILAALADAGVHAQTIASKFTGRFNKGVDYVGNVTQFEKEFSDDLVVIAHAVANYHLPENLKLSVHSGSDKFSLYPIIRRALERTGAGVHLKTAGTTWLEELIGLAEAGGDGLGLAKEIYAQALEHIDELCAPYASVIDIDPTRLPSALAVARWSADQFVNALRHVPGHPQFNPHFRQLLHVAFKLAAKMGTRYTRRLEANEAVVAKNVTENIFARHLQPLFLG